MSYSFALFVWSLQVSKAPASEEELLRKMVVSSIFLRGKVMLHFRIKDVYDEDFLFFCLSFGCEDV